VASKFWGRGDITREKDIEMNRLIKLGLAAAFVVGGASAALAQETTGSIPSGSAATNYGELISKLPAVTAPDLTAFNDSSTINCVKVSTLTEDGSNNAAALDAAVTENQQALSTMQSSIQGNQAFLDKVQSSCAVASVEPAKILAVESGADGAFTVYLDDRAAM
jgi:hypothetical protein